MMSRDTFITVSPPLTQDVDSLPADSSSSTNTPPTTSPSLKQRRTTRAKFSKVRTGCVACFCAGYEPVHLLLTTKVTTTPSPTRYNTALTHYGQALNLARQASSQQQVNGREALVCAMLFVLFEAINGDAPKAEAHLRNGQRVLDACDELRLKQHLAHLPPSPSIRAALIPDLATLQWHFARQDFLAEYQFDDPPRAVRGALFAGASPVWAVWKAHLSEDEKGINTLEFLRLSYQDDIPDEALSTALEAIVEQASHEAQTWRCKRLLLWNPDARVRDVLSSMTHLRPAVIDRKTESIASLLWLGEGGTDAAVEWIANEKFGWC
ncbi:Lysine acetyltransferase [Ophiocordyceps camponoti-floridani]|uniref:Lysine acetyltransferase n=1 Tax=Ophiocordyceps camponoti-floridani TaxID=2030778 RepID=A0A8H4QB91_9HYPO|nr:Lysine acetyltransferase [Ophiocordyceps camponoti-floridani]